MKNVVNSFKKDLVHIPLIAYFVFYFLYLLFDRILELKDYAVIVKPIIIPIIAFLYLSNKNSKKKILSILLLVLIFISDNSQLLELRTFYIYSTLIYLFALAILLFYAVTDIKFLLKKQSIYNQFGLTLIFVIVSFLLFLVFNFDLNEKAGEKFVAYGYMLLFLVVFIISLLNFMQQKTKKTKYLFLTLLCLFLTDLCFSIHHYYNGHIILKYLICVVEIPVYYFLLKYLIKRDKEAIEQ